MHTTPATPAMRSLYNAVGTPTLGHAVELTTETGAVSLSN